MADIKATMNKELIIQSLETYHDALFTPGVYEHSIYGQAALLLKRDVVEVVRCKDCKHYTERKRRCEHPCLDWDVECYDHWLDMNPDDFCSYGERRADHV